MGRKVVRSMNLQTEREIWRRVKGPGGIAAEEALLPERLEALITEERSLAVSLRSLTPRLRGPQRGELTRIAARAEGRARGLTTLHYLLTARRLRLPPPRPGKPGPLPEALREACLRLRETAKAYESLRGEFSSCGEELNGYSTQTAADARALTVLLERQLRQPR